MPSLNLFCALHMSLWRNMYVEQGTLLAATSRQLCVTSMLHTQSSSRCPARVPDYGQSTSRNRGR